MFGIENPLREFHLKKQKNIDYKIIQHKSRIFYILLLTKKKTIKSD